MRGTKATVADGHATLTKGVEAKKRDNCGHAGEIPALACTLGNVVHCWVHVCQCHFWLFCFQMKKSSKKVRVTVKPHLLYRVSSTTYEHHQDPLWGCGCLCAYLCVFFFFK